MSSQSDSSIALLFEAVKPTTLEDEIDRAIAANSNAVVADLDTGIIVLTKPNAELLFGYEPGELKGKSVHVLVPERFRPSHEIWFAQYRLNPQNRTMGARGMELKGVTKQGKEFPVEIGLTSKDLGELRIVIATIIHMIERH